MEILGNNNTVEPQAARRRPAREDAVTEFSSLEATIFKVLLVNPYFAEKLLENQEIIQSSLGKKIENIMFEKYGLNGGFEQSDIMDSLDPEESQTFAAALDKIIVAGNEDQVFDECIRKWKLSRAVRKEQELIDRLALADEDNNSDSIKELTAELMKVQNEIKSFGGRK